MSVKDAVDLARGRHTRERDRLDAEISREVAKRMEKLNPAIRRHMFTLWMQEFGDLNYQPTPREAENFAVMFRFSLEAALAPEFQPFEELLTELEAKARKIGRRQAKERLAALYAS